MPAIKKDLNPFLKLIRRLCLNALLAISFMMAFHYLPFLNRLHNNELTVLFNFILLCWLEWEMGKAQPSQSVIFKKLFEKDDNK